MARNDSAVSSRSVYGVVSKAASGSLGLLTSFLSNARSLAILTFSGKKSTVYIVSHLKILLRQSLTHSVSRSPGETALTRILGPWVAARHFTRCRAVSFQRSPLHCALVIRTCCFGYGVRHRTSCGGYASNGCCQYEDTAIRVRVEDGYSFSEEVEMSLAVGRPALQIVNATWSS